MIKRTDTASLEDLPRHIGDVKGWLGSGVGVGDGPN